MSIRKTQYGFQVRVTGFPATTLPTRQAAETVELDLKLRRKMGDLFQEKPTTFGEELDRYEDRKVSMGGKKGKLRPNTVAFYADSKRGWKALRDVPLDVLRRSQVEDHIVARAKKAPVAARNELQFAKAALRDAADRGQRVDQGIFRIRPIRHEPKRGRVLSHDDLDVIAAWMPDRLGRIVLLAGRVGLRWNEAVNLTDAMVDLARAEVEIPERLNKSRKDKQIPLSRREVTLIRQQMLERPTGTSVLFPTAAGRVYSKSGFRSVWTRATDKAGHPGFRFHWLRHTAISHMAMAGMKPEQIAVRVGHTDGGKLIMERYRHLFADEVRNAVLLLDAYESVDVEGTQEAASL